MSDARDRARTVLPIPERPHVGLTTYDAKDPNTAFPSIEPLRPPSGAPNVLVILIDDAGSCARRATVYGRVNSPRDGSKRASLGPTGIDR